MLALRQVEGLSEASFTAEFGQSPRAYFGAEIDAMKDRGWLWEAGASSGDLRLTSAGRLFADTVAAEFVGAD